MWQLYSCPIRELCFIFLMFKKFSHLFSQCINCNEVSSFLLGIHHYTKDLCFKKIVKITEYTLTTIVVHVLRNRWCLWSQCYFFFCKNTSPTFWKRDYLVDRLLFAPLPHLCPCWNTCSYIAFCVVLAQPFSVWRCMKNYTSGVWTVSLPALKRSTPLRTQARKTQPQTFTTHSSETMFVLLPGISFIFMILPYI